MNQRGISVTLLLAALPLFLTLFFFVIQLLHCLHVHMATHFRCRTTLLFGQRELSELLVKLFAMNATASSLQELEAAAERALRIATLAANAPGIAAAKAALLTVHRQQDGLRFAQNVLLMQARAIAQRLPLDLRSSQEFRSSELTHKMPPGLAVRPIPRNSRSPRYEPVPRFEYAQSAAAVWQSPILNLVPKAVRGPWQMQARIPGRCSATIREEKKQWVPVLNRASL